MHEQLPTTLIQLSLCLEVLRVNLTIVCDTPYRVSVKFSRYPSLYLERNQGQESVQSRHHVFNAKTLA